MKHIPCAAYAALICSVFAGCATTQPTTTIKVPVPVECQEPMPARPAMPTEAFTAKPTLDAYVKAARAELERREGYEGKLRTALDNCRAPISQPPKGTSP